MLKRSLRISVFLFYCFLIPIVAHSSFGIPQGHCFFR